MNFVKKADFSNLDDLIGSSNEIPEDYEPCSECGYDHEYETQEAQLWHSKNNQKQDSDYRFDEEKPRHSDFEKPEMEFFKSQPKAINLSSPKEDISVEEDDILFSKDDKETKKDEDEGPEELEDEVDDSEVVISIIEEGEEPQVFKFELGALPGAEISDADLEIEEPEEEVVVEERDMWDWKSGGLHNFLSWLSKMFQDIPKHSGHDTSGLERVIAYLSSLDKEISKAVRSDIRGQIDVNKVEEARNTIKDGIARCNDRLDRLNGKGKKKKTKKASDEDGSLVKEAQKAVYVGGISVTVPLFISRLARICINGSVSGGHDIEDIFHKLVKKYDLDKREQAELLQLLEDMNYPILRDRGFNIDEEFDRTGENGFDWSAQYYA